MPAGAVIVLTAGVLFLFSFLFAPQRGVLAGLGRMFRLRLKVAREHLLREAYEVLEASGKQPAANTPIAINAISIIQTWSKWLTPAMLKYLKVSGLISLPNAQSLALTDSGLNDAYRCTRNHRLWEEYLLSYSSVAAAHVDYSADYVEHVLNAELIGILEDKLRAKGRLVHDSMLPDSVHPIAQESNA
jgi:manganese/zinc/iron transport system permease protein